MVRMQLVTLGPLVWSFVFAVLGLGVGAVLSADAWTKKLMDRIAQAGPAWEDGMRGAQGTITSRAKASNTKWKGAVQKAVTDDAFLKGLGRITDDEIIAQAIKVGGQALVSGVQSRDAKVLKAITALQPKVAALQARLAAMPTDTETQAEQKALEAIRGMRAIGRELAGLGR